MVYGTLSVSERETLPPAVAVSTVAFALHPPADAHVGHAPRELATAPESADTLWLPLVRRTKAPFSGDWALPGGPIPFNETLADTAVRTLQAAVLRKPSYLEQLYSFGEVERSGQAQRLVTIAYWALYGDHDFAGTADHAADNDAEGNAPRGSEGIAGDPNVAWFSADRLPALAFDHAEIVRYALDRLRSKTEYSTVAYRFLGDTFTLAQLREVHEAVRGESVDPANFRRSALAQGHLVDTGEMTSGERHRPSRIYRFREQQHPRTRSLA